MDIGAIFAHYGPGGVYHPDMPPRADHPVGTTSATANPEDSRYWAFISYSHTDEKWASWLHRRLERYRVPGRLRGAGGERLPRRLFPIFRDREELASAAELGSEIERALAQSRNLIVICSPRAARSRWVNEEVRQFKRLGRAAQIFPLIVDGEPDHPELECFAPALKFHLDAQGAVGNRPAEPMAADAHPQGDGRADALLKLVAGLLGVGYGDLRQRDLKARNRRLSLLAAAAAVVATVTIALAIRANQARVAAEAAETAANATADFLVELFAAGNPDEARTDIPASELLAIGAQRVEAEMADQPLLQARLQQVIGKAYCGMRRHSECDAHTRRALELQQIHGPDDAAALGAMHTIRAESLFHRERLDQAESATLKSIDYWREAGPAHRTELAAQVALLANIRGNRDMAGATDAEELANEAVRLLRQAGEVNSEAYANALGLRASWRKAQFRWDETIKDYRETVRILEQLYAPDDIRLAFKVENLARALYFSGEYGEAAELFERTLRIVTEYKGDDHVDLGWSRYYLARIERERGHQDRAMELMRALVRVEEATPQTPDNRYLARALCGHALLLADRGELDRARRACRRGRDILLASDQHRVQMDIVHEALGVIALAAGDADTAVLELANMAAIRRTELDAGQLDTPVAIALHAHALARSGDFAQAEALFAESIAMAESRYGPDYVGIGRALTARAYMHDARGDSAAAAADRRRAKAIFARQSVRAQSIDWTMPLE